MTQHNPASEHGDQPQTRTERIRGLLRGILERGRPEPKPDTPTPNEPGR
jgi:hypothetical protein